VVKGNTTGAIKVKGTLTIVGIDWWIIRFWF
jgi:hypothetical protein